MAISTYSVTWRLDVKNILDNLADFAGLTPTDGVFIVGDGANWVAESGATARLSLGLPSVATIAAMTALSDAALAGVSHVVVTDVDRGGSFKVLSGTPAANSLTADSGTVFASDGGGYTFQRIFDGPLWINWFDVKGDGTTDDTANILTAQTALEALGNGARMKWPVGTYLISGTITIAKGVWWDFEGFGDESSGASPNSGVSKLLWKAGSGAGTMVRVVSSTLGNRVFYGGISGSVMLDGNDEAATGLYGSSLQGFNVELLYTYRTVSNGCLLDNANNALLSNVHFNVFRHLGGSNAAVVNGHGMTIDGDQHSSGGTSIFIEEFEAEHQDGDALRIRGVDTCFFGRVRCISRNGHSNFGGTDTGYGVRFLKSTTAIDAQKNFIAHLGRGTVYVEDDTISNRIGFFNSEAGSVEFENGVNPGTLHYEVVDRVHGDMFTTHKWLMQDRHDVNLGTGGIVSGTPAIASVGGFGPPMLLFGSGSTEEYGWTILAPNRWNNGEITGLRIFGAQAGAAASGDVVLQYELATRGAGVAVGAAETSGTSTVTTSGTGGVLEITTITFGTALSYTRDDVVYFVLGRLGGDASDTFVNDYGIMGIQLLYASDGPDSTGTGPWEVPVLNMD